MADPIDEKVARALDAEAADAMATNPEYAEGFRRAAAFVRRWRPAGRAAATPDPQPDPAVCNRCGAGKGLHAVGESCNQNCGGRVVVRPRPAASPDERLREALAFYADKSNYTAQNPVGSGAHVWQDMGQRARAALAADRDSLAEKPETDT